MPGAAAGDSPRFALRDTQEAPPDLLNMDDTFINYMSSSPTCLREGRGPQLIWMPESGRAGQGVPPDAITQDRNLWSWTLGYAARSRAATGHCACVASGSSPWRVCKANTLGIEKVGTRSIVPAKQEGDIHARLPPSCVVADRIHRRRHRAQCVSRTHPGSPPHFGVLRAPRYPSEARGDVVAGDPMTLAQARRELDKEIYEAIERQMSDQRGVWTVTRGGHKAVLICDAGCCRISVGGTVRNPARAARDIARRMARHPQPEDDPRARVRRG